MSWQWTDVWSVQSDAVSCFYSRWHINTTALSLYTLALYFSLLSSSQKHTLASCQMKTTLQNDILRQVTDLCIRCMDWFSKSSAFGACRGLSQTHELLCQSHGWPGFTDRFTAEAAAQRLQQQDVNRNITVHRVSSEAYNRNSVSISLLSSQHRQ